MEDILGSISLRPIKPDDEDFLFRLYASTRENELAALAWDETQKQTFINMQFGAQMQQYRMCYPDADNSLILLKEEGIGRLIVNRSEDELTLIDISLLPAHRGHGIGTRLIRDLLSEAAIATKPVRLHVLETNPAKELYERLGFSIVNSDGLYCEMIWTSDQNSKPGYQ
jgi:ribosomal protein S18 acetylase RimI-like enzyme